MVNASRPYLVMAGAAAAQTTESKDGECEPSEQIRCELHRILGSQQFDASDRNRRFLEYIVEETLMGRGDRIKAYSIATVVFGRDDSFDPTLDPVVRMEARRLRSSLERFYLVEGDGGSIRIALPKGAYVPKFENPAALRPDQVARSAGAASARRAPSIFVSPFKLEGDTRVNFNDGLARQIVIGLGRFPECSVFMSGAEHFPHSECDPASGIPDVDYILTGNAAASNDALEVKATILHARTGRIVWADKLHASTKTNGLLSERDRIADHIVRSVIDRITASSDAIDDVKAGESRSFSCFEGLVRFNQYRCALRPDAHSIARTSLEWALKGHPDDPEALACLSQICSDEYLLGFVPGVSFEPVPQALRLATQAVYLAPDSSRAHHALGVAEWLSGDLESSLASLRTAFSLNPNATDAMAEFGLHSCLSGDWDNGVPLVEEALSRHPALATVQRLAIALHLFLNGDHAEAFKEARQMLPLHSAYGLLARAITLIPLGRQDEAMGLIRRILGVDQRRKPTMLPAFEGSMVGPSAFGEKRSAPNGARLSKKIA